VGQTEAEGEAKGVGELSVGHMRHQRVDQISLEEAIHPLAHGARGLFPPRDQDGHSVLSPQPRRFEPDPPGPRPDRSPEVPEPRDLISKQVFIDDGDPRLAVVDRGGHPSVPIAETLRGAKTLTDAGIINILVKE
jgi:hypothetical protein